MLVGSVTDQIDLQPIYNRYIVQIDRQVNRYTGRQIYRKINIKVDRYTGRQIDSQVDIKIDRKMRITSSTDASRL